MAKYSKKAENKISDVMHEYKHGKLKSGGSGKKVKSRKQAVAIAISEARESGAKVPKKKSAGRPAKKKAARKSKSANKSAKRSTGKATKKKAAKKSTGTRKKSVRSSR